jgi:uncharacterized damage-inducible protein DinB
MDNAPVTKADIAAQLDALRQKLNKAMSRVRPAQFCQVTTDKWSAADYLKHLLISNKPIARAMRQDPDSLVRTFGSPDHASRTFDEIKALYDAGLASGFKAEDVPNVMPDAYRFPSDVERGNIPSEVVHLSRAWDEVNDKMIASLQAWDEATLDRVQIPHPALGLLTMREMMYFTIGHNGLHVGDAVRVLQAL